MKCICGNHATHKHPVDGTTPVCRECLANSIRADILPEIEETDRKILRRRIEDALRKNPVILYKVAADLAADNQIKYQDLI